MAKIIVDKLSEKLYAIIPPISKPRNDAISFINPLEKPFTKA